MREDITSAAGLRKEEGGATSKCQGSLVLKVFRVYEDYTIFVETSHTPPPFRMYERKYALFLRFNMPFWYLRQYMERARLSNTLLTLW